MIILLRNITILVLISICFYNHIKANDQVDYDECMAKMKDYCGDLLLRPHLCARRAIIHWSYYNLEAKYLETYHVNLKKVSLPDVNFKLPDAYCSDKAYRCIIDLQEFINATNLLTDPREISKLYILNYAYLHTHFRNDYDAGHFAVDYLKDISNNIYINVIFQIHVKANDQKYNECVNFMENYCGDIFFDPLKCAQRAVRHWSIDMIPPGYMSAFNLMLKNKLRPGEDFQIPGEFCANRAPNCLIDLSEFTEAVFVFTEAESIAGVPHEPRRKIMNHAFLNTHYQNNYGPNNFAIDYLRHIANNLSLIEYNQDEIFLEEYCIALFIGNNEENDELENNENKNHELEKFEPKNDESENIKLENDEPKTNELKNDEPGPAEDK